MSKIKKFLLSVSVIVMLMVLTTIPTFALTLKPDIYDSPNKEVTVYGDIQTSSFYGNEFGYGSSNIVLIVPLSYEGTDISEYNISFIQCTDAAIGKLDGAYFTSYFKENIVDYVLENKIVLEEKYNTEINYNSQSVFDFITKKDFFDGEYRILPVASVDYNTLDEYITNSCSDESYFAYVLEETKNFEGLLEFASFDKEYGSYIELFGKKKELSILEEQVSELNTTITEKDSTITSLESDKLTLQNSNASLQNNINSLNNQVATLNEDRMKLNAEITSLENQMQLKINKAYAEGLNDSDGEGNRVNGFISTLVIILTVAELVALVYFIVSKAKKRKNKSR